MLPLIYGLDANARTRLPMQKAIIAYVFPQDRELLHAIPQRPHAVAKRDDVT